MSIRFNLTILVFALGSSIPLVNSPVFAQDTAHPQTTYTFPFDIKEPSASWALPNFLEEISALSWDNRKKMLVTLQDESGNLFFLEDGKVREELEFWKDGDYEGVEVVGDDIIAMKSSGTLYYIKNAGKKDQSVEKYNDFLTQDHDVEGLGYDAANNRLLLACKGKAGDGSEFRLKKAIYAFDLEKMALLEDPAYIISFEDVHDYLEISPSIRKWEKLMEFFQPNETNFTFSPSAIAVSPDGSELYVLSTAGKYILILDKLSGKIKHIEKLPKKMHPQPEGICFDDLGNLYISNEGKGGTPMLYRYTPRAD